MTQALETKRYTPEEYLDLELASEERHEYADGEVRLMAGGTPNHNDLAGNLYILLKLALKGKPYRTFYVNQRLWVPDPNLYTYPDVMVLPKPLQLQPGRTDTVMNPCFVAEVLSKSTQDRDRCDKFVAYRTIASLCEYLWVDQYGIRVEHYVKTAAHQWLLSEYRDPETTLRFDTLDMQVQIADIYEGIEFSS